MRDTRPKPDLEFHLDSANLYYKQETKVFDKAIFALTSVAWKLVIRISYLEVFLYCEVFMKVLLRT